MTRSVASINECDRPACGLIAGWGRLPLVTAAALKRSGYRVICVGVRDHADPELAVLCDAFQWVGLGQLGKSIRFLKRHGCRRATMAGKIHKVKLFERGAWLKHLPDWVCFRTLYPHWVTKTADRKDDTILLAIVNAFERAGIQLAPATDFAPELLVNEGCITKRRLPRSLQKDVEFGWPLAKEMGRLDIGQTVVVKGRAVVAVEAVEGTDLCIRRAGELCPQGGFTVIKVAKPQQDMRFDVPTIGMETLKTMAASGAACLAVEAGKTILLDEPQFIRLAEDLGIAVVALDPASMHVVEPLSSTLHERSDERAA